MQSSCIPSSFIPELHSSASFCRLVKKLHSLLHSVGKVGDLNGRSKFPLDLEVAGRGELQRTRHEG